MVTPGRVRQQREMTSAVAARRLGGASGGGRGGDVLAAWAESLSGRAASRSRGRLRFAFYGRVSTEDWQDPVTSRARQLEQAVMLVAGQGVIAAEFFDTGESRTLPWARRPQAAALVAQLADPDRGWDAVVIGEYERAFYASQCRAVLGVGGLPENPAAQRRGGCVQRVRRRPRGIGSGARIVPGEQAPDVS